jgi:hypothetical protein
VFINYYKSTLSKLLIPLLPRRLEQAILYRAARATDEGWRAANIEEHASWLPELAEKKRLAH